MPTQLEQARKVVSDLEAKRAALEARKARLEDERDDLAYHAHTGDKKAKVKLTEVIGEIIQLDGELASFAAAIRTAEGKVLEAQGIERAEIERKRGEAALKLGREMRDHGSRADQAMTDTFKHLVAMHDISRELSMLGCPPSPALVESGLLRALKAASMNSRNSRFILEHLAPNERHTASELAARWNVFIEGWATQRLGSSAREPGEPKEEVEAA